MPCGLKRKRGGRGKSDRRKKLLQAFSMMISALQFGRARHPRTLAKMLQLIQQTPKPKKDQICWRVSLLQERNPPQPAVITPSLFVLHHLGVWADQRQVARPIRTHTKAEWDNCFRQRTSKRSVNKNIFPIDRFCQKARYDQFRDPEK